MQTERISCKYEKEKIFTETIGGFPYVCGIGCCNIECLHSGELTFGIGFTEKQAEKNAIKRWNRGACNAEKNEPFTYSEHRTFCRLFGLKPRNPISWLLLKIKKKAKERRS